jgi:Xaa-Pro aminopeptidase
MLDIRKARAKMDEEGIDVLIAVSPTNVYYACGYHHPYCNGTIPERIKPVVIPKNSEPFVIAQDNELDDVKKQSRIDDVVPIPTMFYGRYDPGPGDHHKEAVEAFKEVDLSPLIGISTNVGWIRHAVLHMVKKLKGRDLDRSVIAVDSKARLTALCWEEIERGLPYATLKDGHDIWAELRQIKSEEEIKLIGEAVRITQKAFEQVAPMVKAGVMHSEVACALKKALTSSYSLPTELSISFSGNPNDTITDALLQDGQQLLLDIGCTYKWYHSDVARMISIGEPPSELLRIYNAAVEAQETVINMIRPGVSMVELFDAAMSIMLKADPNYRRMHFGHSIGLEIWEEPMVKKSDFRLLPGHVIAVEIPYYWLGHFACNIEDVIVVTSDGFEYVAGYSLSKNIVINK